MRPGLNLFDEGGAMGKRRYELDTRVLTVFFFVAMPFVAFGSFVVVNMARGALQAALGEALEQRSLETKVHLERYIGNRFIDLHILAKEPQVQAAIAESRPLGPDQARALEQAWSSADEKATASLLGSPVALRLREFAQLRPGIRLLQLVDSGGRLVATSGRGGRLLNAETPWFRALLLDAQRPHVTDVHRPAGGSLALLEIAYPLQSPEDGRLLGAVRAVYDATDLYTVLAPVRVGRTGHAVLLRSTDGLVLASDETSKLLTQRFPGFGAIQAAIAERRGHWFVPEIREKGADGAEGALVEPRRFVGFAAVEQVPGVQWLVAVEQDAEEAEAPILGVTRYLWIHFIGAFLTVILLALYFSFKLEAPVIEEELHLHEEHVAPSARATPP
jgi:hypothetical protein